MRRLLMALVLALTACVSAGQDGPRLPVPTKNVRVVEDFGIFTNHWQWQRTPWFRAADGVVEFPVRVLIDQQGYACIVSGADWAVTLPKTPFACPGKWIAPRKF